MPYDINEDPYVNPRTGILRNKVRAKTQAQLDKVEGEITFVAIATLTKGSNLDNLKFDSDLLCDVHNEIFRDIYSWAGTIRTHDISKDSEYFAHAAYIQPAMGSLSKELTNDNILSSGDKTAVIDRLTYYYSEYNAIHPFREGNGRAIRTFLRLLALRHGYDIEWNDMGKEENIIASKEAMVKDPIKMRSMLNRLVTAIK
jgi:cell filamentation protein